MARSTPSSRQRNARRRKKDSTAQAIDFLNTLTAFNEASSSSDEDMSEEEPSAETRREENHPRTPLNDLPNGPDGERAATSWRDRLRRRPPRQSRVDNIFDMPQSPEVNSSPGLRRSARLNRFRSIDNNPETTDTERRVDRGDTGSSDSDDDAVSESDVSGFSYKISPGTPSHDRADHAEEAASEAGSSSGESSSDPQIKSESSQSANLEVVIRSQPARPDSADGSAPAPPRSPSQQRSIPESHGDSARSRKRALGGDDSEGGASPRSEASDDDSSIIRPSTRQRRLRSARRTPPPQTDVPTTQQSAQQNSQDGAVTSPQIVSRRPSPQVNVPITQQSAQQNDADGAVSVPESVHRRPSPQTNAPATHQSDQQNSQDGATTVPQAQQNDADGAVSAPQPETVTINGVQYEKWDAEDMDKEANAQAENDARRAQPESPEDRLFTEASRVLQQQENWADLVTNARYMRKEGDLIKSVRFRSIDDIKEHISGLCTLYGEIQEQRSTGNRVDVGLLHDSEARVEMISHKAFRILSRVQKRATSGGNAEDQRQGKADAQRLLDQFQIDVIPHLVEAAQACLKAHYTWGWLTAEGFGAVHRILLVLSSSCERIFTLKRSGIVYAQDRSRALRPTLRSLLRAMERGEFEQRLQSWAEQQAYPSTSRTEVINLESDDDEQEEEWTEDEAIAILDGLRMFQGPDRFRQLVQRFGDRLRGRTMAEIRAKARELRDSYLDAMGDSAELRTEHGRRQFAWLINV
ncbi:hypothetical protein VTN96DRAFT_9926 [Rasamsonia emersonii]|uniref:Uncharacterized protein n=1 Tax=Rasamsonia emersonii (strain ATCC 16479 / CBS 393.64 / IMI 116815) TaxID=1408163 RepID=A0A0F4Z304_RASE3|nr:Uncharacterized protein T310_1717 [Rasamsonia emersonii CBS 393.64]KKA24253.1 Uncharacterized protein T310_1717 [Rasamsonia emersonii CBS 393.64]